MTLLEYAIEHDLSVKQVLLAFVRKELSPEVGAVDATTDHTREHWAIRQGVPIARCRFYRLFSKWPLETPCPPKWPDPPRAMWNHHLSGYSPWWEQELGIKAIQLHQVAIDNGIRAVNQCVRRVNQTMREEYRQTRKRAYLMQARLNQLRLLQVRLESLLRDAMDVAKNGQAILAAGGNIAKLTESVLSPDVVRQHLVADRLTRRRQSSRRSARRTRDRHRDAIATAWEHAV